MQFADGPGTFVTMRIDAPAVEIWPIVTDIELPARFSEEFLGAEWVGQGPGLGASFVGRNQHPAVGEWQTESFVDRYEPGRVFGWAVSDVDQPGARWSFRLEPDEDGTELTFEVALGPGPSGTTMAIEAMPDKEARIIHRRISELHANMQLTVNGIKAIVEENQ